MTPPDFWYDSGKSAGVLKTVVLTCLSWLIYGGAKLQSYLTTCHKVTVPVICVGNFTVGGAGKTPTTIYLAQYLRDKGLTPAIVSRGYRGRLRGPLKVDFHHHTHLDVGDEPLMMAQYCQVYVAKKRYQGARLAEQEGADVIIMDDGLQHPSLYQDLKLSVIDEHRGFGNKKLLPAGPLREPIDVGLARIDGVMMIQSHAHLLDHNASLIIHKPCVSASIVMTPADLDALRGRPLIAFAGLAHPDKFFNMLVAEGLEVIESVPFPDHHIFTEDDFARLKEQALRHQATLVTTEKDFVRLSPDDKKRVTVVRISLDCQDETLLDRLLNPIYQTVLSHDT